MTVKEAVTAAKNYIQEVFADEQISDLGLEEVEFEEDTKCWRITVGLALPYYATSSKRSPLSDSAVVSLLDMMREKALRRSYKVVTIKDSTGEVVSVRNRELQTAA